MEDIKEIIKEVYFDRMEIYNLKKETFGLTMSLYLAVQHRIPVRNSAKIIQEALREIAEDTKVVQKWKKLKFTDYKNLTEDELKQVTGFDN